MTLAALILAGGASRRMGVSKAAQDWGGVRAVDRVAELARRAGAGPVLVCGVDLGLPYVLDPTPQAGPVAGILAGAAALQGWDRALVLAVDAPTLTLADLAPLLAREGAAYTGFPLPMALPLAAIPDNAEPDWPLSRFADQAGIERLPCPADVAIRIRGANTPEERNALLRL